MLVKHVIATETLNWLSWEKRERIDEKDEWINERGGTSSLVSVI